MRSSILVVRRLGLVEEEDQPPVAAAIAVALGRVAGLMKIANEMNNELERLGPLLFACTLVRQHLLESLDRVDHVLAVLAVALRIESGLRRGMST